MKSKPKREWSIAWITEDNNYLVTPVSESAKRYANELFGEFKRLASGAYVIPALMMSAHFTIVGR